MDNIIYKNIIYIMDELQIDKSLIKINKTLKNQPDEKKSPKKRVTKKKSPAEKKSPKKRVTKKKSPVEKKSPKKPKRKLKLVELAPKLSIDEYEIVEKVQPEELDELVPILHMDNNREIIPINAKHNKTVKKLNIIDNDNNINQDKMASKVKLAKKIVEDFQNNGITVLESLTEEELVTVIEGNNHAYYNTNKPLTSDNEYDIIKEYMERKYPKNTIITEVGAKIIKNKVELPYKMASMDKIKPDTNALTKWTTTYKGPYVLSCKLDGVSGLYTTEGEIPKLYTRGNGTIGQDISHLIPVLNLPTEKNSVIRGEFIIPRLVFEEKYKKRFANARNLVSGIVNSKKIDEKTQDLHFVAYEVIQPSLKPSEQMKKIEELGHISVQNQTVDNLTNEMLSGILMDWRTNYEYEIDGVIVTNDRVYTRTDGNPDYAFAFKMVISDQVAEAKVVDVIWTPSKSGYLKPRVRIEPIKLGGVTIEYATGFNGKFIEENKIGIGAIIQIIRSGDVIPYIKSVTTPAEHAKMPVTEYHWTDSHVDLVLDNVTDDETVQEKNITDFFTGIEVESLSTGNVKKIMKAGYRTIPDILKMTKDDFEKVDGFKEKMVNKIYEGIQSKIERASLITIMASSNKFGRGIGKRKITPIMNKYPNILVSDENVNEKIAMLQLIEGIGKENAKGFVNNINNFISFLEECNLHHKLGNTKIEATAETDVEINNGQIHDESNPLYGKYIVMTKVRDAEIIDYLKKVGGHLDNNISKKTFILVVKSLDDVSNKTKKANADNIPIMTPEMFKTEYINT
jgi:DNA ligase (NAD+)